MITFFPREITCLKWQCWAVIRLLAFTLLCRRAASSRAVCLLGGTSARELCHQAQAARDLLSGPTAAGMLSQPQWQKLPACIGNSHPLELMPQPWGPPDNTLTLSSPSEGEDAAPEEPQALLPLREGKGCSILYKTLQFKPHKCHPVRGDGPKGSCFPAGKYPPSQTNKWENSDDTALVHFVLVLTFILCLK